jgi:hypothetical protein
LLIKPLINTTQAHYWDPFQVELAQRSSAEHRHIPDCKKRPIKNAITNINN